MPFTGHWKHSFTDGWLSPAFLRATMTSKTPSPMAKAVLHLLVMRLVKTPVAAPTMTVAPAAGRRHLDLDIANSLSLGKS
jgi:hypothetical protein